MKILFFFPEIEQTEYRGIQRVSTNLIAAFAENGVEVDLLAGYPLVPQFKHNPKLNSKIQNLYLQHYLNYGSRDRFSWLEENISKQRVYTQVIKGLLGKHFSFKVSIDARKGGELKLLSYISNVIQVPYIYQLHNRKKYSLVNRMLRKVVRKNDIDVVVTSTPTGIDLGGDAKLIQYVHDLMPVELIETPHINLEALGFAKQITLALNNSDIILVNSDDTRSKIEDLGYSSKLVETIHPPISSQINYKVLNSPILSRLGLDNHTYFINVGTIETRKNIETLLEAFYMASKEIDSKLVIVGGDGYGADRVRRNYDRLPQEVKDRIIFTGFISEHDKYILLRNADAAIFPTVYEGFGIPVVEAMSLSVPVICSRAGGLVEAGGDAPLYLEDPYSASELSNTIIKLSNNPSLRAQMIKEGQRHANQYSVKQFNRKISKLIEGIL